MLRVCGSDELTDGDALGIAPAGVQVVLVRVRSEVFAYLNRCPHLGVPLQWEAGRFLDAEGQFLRCATHGALFEKDSGLCIQGPCHGESLWQLDCVVREGGVYIDASELPDAAGRSSPA